MSGRLEAPPAWTCDPWHCPGAAQGRRAGALGPPTRPLFCYKVTSAALGKTERCDFQLSAHGTKDDARPLHRCHQSPALAARAAADRPSTRAPRALLPRFMSGAAGRSSSPAPAVTRGPSACPHLNGALGGRGRDTWTWGVGTPATSWRTDLTTAPVVRRVSLLGKRACQVRDLRPPPQQRQPKIEKSGELYLSGFISYYTSTTQYSPGHVETLIKYI